MKRRRSNIRPGQLALFGLALCVAPGLIWLGAVGGTLAAVRERAKVRR